MRSENEMYEIILNKARNDERIRAVILNGSRLNSYVPEDNYRDFDIVYVVTETKSFIDNPSWINIFGDILVMQKPDEIDKVLGYEMNFEKSFAYLMQFKDGNRIDLHIQTIDAVSFDEPFKVLLNKDSFSFPQSPGFDIYNTKTPSKAEFEACINEFWWIVLYAVKGLARSEILYAQDQINFHIRPELLKMVKWYAVQKGDAAIGKGAKYLNKFIPADIYNRYLDTYCTTEPKEIFRAVNNICNLFSDISKNNSEFYGFSYNAKQPKTITEYINKIKDSLN